MTKLDKITKKVRKCAKEGKVRMAPNAEVERFWPLVEEFLDEVLDHPEALVTDMSEIRDFRDNRTPEQYQKWVVKRAKKVYNIDITDVYKAPLPVVAYFIFVVQGVKKTLGIK